MDGTFRIADPYYKPADPKVIMQVVTESLCDLKPYITHFRDCDNFALSNIL